MATRSDNRGNEAAPQQDDDDIKPPRGYIPHVPEASTSHTASHGFFKVFLIVGDDEEMIPVKLEKPQPTLSIQHFVAIPGRNFSCRVELARAPPEGIQYGCRIYIDHGSIRSRHEFDPEQGIRVLKEPDEFKKKHDPDAYNQFIWFGPGETSYTVHGFYCNEEQEYQFQFGEIPRETKEKAHVDEQEILQRKDRLGVIRFQFAKVKRMVPNTLGKHSQEKPLQAKDFSRGETFAKGTHMSARPGKRIKVGVRRDTVAELEDNICYEAVIHYNDVFGYQNSNVNIYGDPRGLRGIPLSQITGHLEFRSFLINRFLTWLQSQRFAAEISRATNDAASNKYVGLEDLVHFIDASLSPAAAYILCTGRQGPNNFGEKLVQASIGAAEHQRAKHFQDKEDGLFNFFDVDPANFELENNGCDQAGRVLWSVRKPWIEIDDESE